MENDTVFRITYSDIESILGRKLKQEEKDIVFNKFTIEDWHFDVESFLDCRDIKK